MHEANRALEDYLRAGELGCHPDLELRLRELGESEPDPEFAIPVLRVMSSNNMKIAVQTATSVHHLRSMARA